MNRVAELALKLGTAEAKTKRLRAELYAEMRRAHELGASLALIARTAGVSRSRVQQIVTKED